MTSSGTWFSRLALIPGLAVAMILASLALSSPAQAKNIRPVFFGMHDSQLWGGSVPRVQLGAVRLWDSGTAWRQIETAPGVFDWSTVDAVVATARGAGLKPMLVLGQTPRFHAENRRAPGAYGRGSTSMPRIAAWKRYASAAAKRYGTRVEYQIWNEPNVINYWTGSVAQMARLTATASKAITKAAGRKATVVAPAFPLRLDNQQKWFQRYWSAKAARKGMSSYADVVSVNLYPSADGGPEESMKLLGFAKRALPKAARKLPIWNTEINYGLLGGPAAKRIPVAKQAAFVARTLLLNAASPIRRVYWYAWGQGPIANTHLVKRNRTRLTRAGRAWDMTSEWLNGTAVKTCRTASRGKLRGVYTCTARASRREVRRFYWKPSGRVVTIATHRTTTKWSDLSGDTKRRKGRTQIKVGQSPVMVSSRR